MISRIVCKLTKVFHSQRPVDTGIHSCRHEILHGNMAIDIFFNGKQYMGKSHRISIISVIYTNEFVFERNKALSL